MVYVSKSLKKSTKEEESERGKVEETEETFKLNVRGLKDLLSTELKDWDLKIMALLKIDVRSALELPMVNKQQE